MKPLAALACAVLLASCAAKDFARPQDGRLKLGTTTYGQLVEAFGSPHRTATATLNGVPVKTVTYASSEITPYTTKLSAKSLVCVFSDDVLVSYDYASSFASDKQPTAFDGEQIKRIQKGDSKAKVRTILGAPGGEAVFPAVPKAGDSLMRYTSLTTYRIPFLGSRRHIRKVLTVSFDASDGVTDAATSESTTDE